MATTDETTQTDANSQAQFKLTPMEYPDGYVPGKYAPWRCSPEPIYGPDELGELKSCVDDLSRNVEKQDSAARVWEVLQAWEARFFRRGYHFLGAGFRGWTQQAAPGATSPAAIMQSQQTMKLFPVNVYGARHKKIVALLSREVPGIDVVASDESDPIDQAAAEEAEKYLKVLANDADLKKAVRDIASFFYTDDRAATLTYTVADQTRWGTELAEREQTTYGPPMSEGVSPETEQGDGKPKSEVLPPEREQPARREVAEVYGKLECKVPLIADEESDMGWIRCAKERNVNRLRAQYPWIAKKIVSGGSQGGSDSIDRLARVNVRLAVQSSSTSGQSWQNDATESVIFYRPAEYEAIKDDEKRQAFYDNFPKGLEVWHAAGELAFVRQAQWSKHVKVVHPTPGDGQNREALGTNYLPLQKILNAEFSLLDRYIRAAIPRRFAREPFIDTQLMNTQANDPAKSTPIYLPEGSPLKISDLTGIENTPSPNDSIFQIVQWLIQGAPEAMDGGSPAVFGLEDEGSSDQGVYQTAKLRRDQALQVYSMPWSAICDAICAISQQAIESAAANRKTNISASVPGQQKLEIQIEKLRGSVLTRVESVDIPQTIAEEERQMVALLEQSTNVALYQAIVSDPRNLVVFSKFPSMRDLEIPGSDAVEQQQGEFEVLMRSGPVPNPQYQQIEQQVAAAEGDGEAATPEGQAALAQLQEALQKMPQMNSTVPVAQDKSENHAIHAQITLGMLTSATGRKLKYGDEQQQAIYQNLHCHWQEHMRALDALKQPPQVEMKATVTIDPTKLPPEAQAKAFQALGLAVSPEDVTPSPMEHEVTTEKEGVDANGVPVKQKVSVVGKPLN